MKFKPGDICVDDPQFSFDCFLIKENAPARGPIQYRALSLKNNTIYIVDESRLEKIGEVLPDLGVAGVEAILNRKPTLPTVDSLEVLIGRARAKREVDHGDPAHRAYWAYLANAKPGDRLHIRTRRGIEHATFHYVIERGEKYVFLAEDMKGKLLRYYLTSLILPT
jgi:hypothetical protein